MGDAVLNDLLAIVLVVAGLCLVVIIVMQSLRISSLKKRIDDLTGGLGEGTLEDVLIQHLESVHAMGNDVDDLVARMAVIEAEARHHFSHQGLVRFNPFPDTGGNQSFVLALLDDSYDGFVISSLHSRAGTRIYAKAVVGGKTDTNLSAEETQAIEEARARRSTTAVGHARARTGRDAVRGALQAPVSTAQPAVPDMSSPVASPIAAAPVAPEPIVPEPIAPEPVASAEQVAEEAEPAAQAVGEAESVEASAGAHTPVAGTFEAAGLETAEEPISKPIDRPESSKGQAKGDGPAASADGSVDEEKTGPRPGGNAGVRP